MRTRFTKKLTLPALRTTLELSAILWPRLAGDLALRVFSTPRKGKILAGQYPWLDEARLEQLPVKDRLVQAYHWPGPGPTVLLLHGWESNTSRWKGLLDTLIAADFDVMAIDAPAHGYSDGQRFTAVFYAHCLAVAIDRFSPSAIVAHSAGGMATLYALGKLKQQHSVRKAVVVGTPAGLSGLLKGYQRILGVSQRVMNTLEQAGQRHYQLSLRDFSIPAFASSLQLPGLIIHDHDDELANTFEALDIQRAWVGSRLHLTQGLGHSTQSPEVWRLIADFLID